MVIFINSQRTHKLSQVLNFSEATVRSASSCRSMRRYGGCLGAAGCFGNWLFND